MRSQSPRQLSVLTVIESLGRAGAEQALVNLLPALQERGYRCEVAALWPPYDTAAELEEAGVRVHRLNLRHRWHAPQAVRRLTGLGRRRQFDVLHAHLFFAGIYTALSRPLLTGPRRVISFHNVDYDLYPAESVRRRAIKAMHAALMRYGMDGHAGVSRAVARHFETNLNLARVAVIPNSFPVQRIAPQADLQRHAVLSRYGVNDGEFVVVIAARLVPQKGHRFFIQALHLLAQRGLRAKVLAFGAGPLAQDLADEVARCGLQEQFRLCGAVPHEQLLPIIQAADALALPSTHEGFGLAPAEAMLLEKPVLATTIGGVEDVVEHEVSGLMVPPGDPAALADGLARLMQNPDLCRRLGRQGRQSVVNKFSTSHVAAMWEEFYNDLWDGVGPRKGSHSEGA